MYTLAHKTKFTSHKQTLQKNTVVSPNFLVWKFCGKARFPHGFGRIARNRGNGDCRRWRNFRHFYLLDQLIVVCQLNLPLTKKSDTI